MNLHKDDSAFHDLAAITGEFIDIPMIEIKVLMSGLEKVLSRIKNLWVIGEEVTE